MKTKLLFSKGMIRLGYQDPDSQDFKALAQMDLYEGTGCWRLIDIRLAKYHTPTKYLEGVSEAYHASHKPESPAEAAFVKSRLREYQEDTDGTLRWCTFDGIVRGEPAPKGSRLSKHFDQAGYFSRSGGLAEIKKLKSFGMGLVETWNW